MAKIDNDKYYTPKELARYIVEKTKQIIGEHNITEYLEPSAGAGVFLDYFDKSYLAYDIIPEDKRIIKQDYLNLDLDYKEGRCVIGNPPFGRVNNLATQFYKKSIGLSDYISFILPISQLNNNIKMYEFDLIYSEDLGKINFSENREVYCCLNIYTRNPSGYNIKPNYILKDIEIKEATRGKNKRNKVYTYDDFKYDYRFCGWGSSLGQECKYESQYATEFCIKINNEPYKDKVLALLKCTKWKEICPATITPKLQIWRIYKYLKEQIPELT